MLKIILVAVAVVVCCKGVECAGGVLKFTQVDVQQTRSVNNDFVKCMAKCLGHSVVEIEEWVAECGTDVKCWLEKVGIEAIKCVPRCLSVEIDAKRVADIATVREKGEVGNNFAICLAKCLGRSVADIERWIGECGENVKCWVKKVGFAALKCVPKCVSLEGDAVQNVVANTPENKEKVEVGNDFANCLAKCLGKSVADIERWLEECGTDVHCWLKKVGFAALKCVPECVSLEVYAVQNVFSDSLKNKDHVDNDVVSCLARCLGKSVADIERWIEECKKNVKCWAKKVGIAALKCVPKCTLTAPTRSITLGSWRLEVLNYNTQGEGRRFVQ